MAPSLCVCVWGWVVEIAECLLFWVMLGGSVWIWLQLKQQEKQNSKSEMLQLCALYTPCYPILSVSFPPSVIRSIFHDPCCEGGCGRSQPAANSKRSSKFDYMKYMQVWISTLSFRCVWNVKKLEQAIQYTVEQADQSAWRSLPLPQGAL